MPKEHTLDGEDRGRLPEGDGPHAQGAHCLMGRIALLRQVDAFLRQGDAFLRQVDALLRQTDRTIGRAY